MAVLIGALLGGIGGFAAGLLAFPRLFPAVPVAGVLEEPDAGPVRASGRFKPADGASRNRRADGQVSVYDQVLELGDDFAVGPGPNYHHCLVPFGGLDPQRALEGTPFVDLGPLKAFQGRQRYPIPLGVRLEDYGTVAIWCERLDALIATSELKAEQVMAKPIGGAPNSGLGSAAGR